MSSGQARVAVLLLLLLGLEAVKQPAIKVFFSNLKNQVSGNVSATASGQAATPLTVNPALLAYWLVGAILLIALAGPAPGAATGLVLLIMLALVLSDVGAYTALLTPPPATKP